ncbi:MAG TPA: alpha/beta hydrolase [Burkholderiaceae bacterium]|nr:alpha/beta hydrolase [Burkholderiaceae bacterium]
MPRRYADTSLGQVHLRVQGRGPALLLLGSAGRSLRVFDPLVPLLDGAFTVVAPDLPGSGNSDPLPPGAGITALAACMVEVLASLDIARTHVYGFHTGNKIGAALAAGWPQRVDRLVLAGQSHSLIPVNEERNGVIRGRTRNYFAGQDMRGSEAKAAGDWQTLQRNVNDLWWPAGSTNEGPLRAGALAQARRQVLDEIQCFDGIPTLYEANFAYDFHADLQRIAAPTLVLEVETPDENRKLGPQAERVCALIGHAVSRALRADGFRLTLEDQADELAAVLREFLAG